METPSSNSEYMGQIKCILLHGLVLRIWTYHDVRINITGKLVRTPFRVISLLGGISCYEF